VLKFSESLAHGRTGTPRACIQARLPVIVLISPLCAM